MERGQRAKGGSEVDKFYDTVVALNPNLRKDARITPAIVGQLLESFEKQVKRKKTINYDEVLTYIAEQLNLPEQIVAPFVEVYATYYLVMTDRTFVRLCSHCHKTHQVKTVHAEYIEDKDLIVKTKAGFCVVDGKDRAERFVN